MMVFIPGLLPSCQRCRLSSKHGNQNGFCPKCDNACNADTSVFVIGFWFFGRVYVQRFNLINIPDQGCHPADGRPVPTALLLGKRNLSEEEACQKGKRGWKSVDTLHFYFIFFLNFCFRLSTNFRLFPAGSILNGRRPWGNPWGPILGEPSLTETNAGKRACLLHEVGGRETPARW